MLLETVAEALSILSDEAPSDEENIDEFVRNRAMNFRHLASRYFSLVNVNIHTCTYTTIDNSRTPFFFI